MKLHKLNFPKGIPPSCIPISKYKSLIKMKTFKNLYPSLQSYNDKSLNRYNRITHNKINNIGHNIVVGTRNVRLGIRMIYIYKTRREKCESITCKTYTKEILSTSLCK